MPPIADVPVNTSDDVSHWLTTFNSFASNVNSSFDTSATFSGKMFVEGSAKFSGAMTITSSVVMSSTLTMTSTLTVSGGLSLAGSATMSAASIVGSLTVAGTAALKSRLFVSNFLYTVSGAMTSTSPMFILDGSNNTVGLTLCAASQCIGSFVFIKRKDGSENAVIIGVSGGADLIQGSNGLGLGDRQGAMLYSDGSGWHDFVS
jgi:hypothetical protein